MNNKTTERVTVFIEPQLNTALRVIAAETRRTISDVVAEALVKHLKKVEK
jgi:hypothetical protein